MTEQERIIRYWHAVELLQPQAAPKLTKRSKPHEAFLHDIPIRQPIPPWSATSRLSKQYLPKNRVWSHTLFAHIYDSRCVAEHLNKEFGAEQGYSEPQYRESALFAVKFTMAGQLVDDSFVLSSEAWFLGRVLAGKDWSRGFEDDQKAIGDRAKELFERQVSGDALRELTHLILRYIGVDGFFGDMDAKMFRFRSQPVNPNKPVSEEDPLNSFLLDDLAAVADSISNGEKSDTLNHYLRLHDPKLRLHVDNDIESQSLIERLMPDAYSMGCWPSDRHLGLVHSQQLAVNTILDTLGSSQGLLGINGPPGTGKTTLLRDLIAAIVTSRADALSRLRRASEGFDGDGREEANNGGKRIVCNKLNPALFGFEIVVASSNNGAVENVTLELPQRDKIDESWLPEAEYFAELGELVSEKPAWGMISGALGSKSNRTTFVQRYFDGKRSSKTDAETVDEPSLDVENGQITNELGVASADIQNNGDESEQSPDASSSKDTLKNGFHGWLNACIGINKTRLPKQRLELWQQAIADYEAAKADVRKRSDSACRMRGLFTALCNVRKQIAEQSDALRVLEKRLVDVCDQLSRLDVEELRPAIMALQKCLYGLEAHQACKPGFWRNLFSLWFAQRKWDAKLKQLETQHHIAKSEFERIERLIQRLSPSQQILEKQTDEKRSALELLRNQCEVQTQAAIDLARDSQAKHLLTWLESGAIGRGDDIELAEPWLIEGWRQARVQVFIQALKLHRTFFELEPSRMRQNLLFINDMLTGSRFKGFSRESIRSAWASLFMVVPVLSSTFASFSRSFGSLQAGDIGWLLVDEAGQATPQAAIGALWRSRRALLVGDPLQLKPIVTVSDAALEHMRTHYQVDAHWLPNRQSAQTLADEATRWGRMAGPADSKCWVGLPLVVHRRCDRPMYALANRIAYDGAMVYGTLAPRPDKETQASLPTGWIQACGTSEGNWVPAEGKALEELLARLKQDGVQDHDISVITPFKAVQENLKRLLPDKMISGTIHTMQGKEASVVIMVLGGNSESSGARNWAVSEPNLLNVAATRSKRRFYVIGDRNDWKNRALFCDVLDLLPLQPFQISEQEKMPFSH